MSIKTNFFDGSSVAAADLIAPWLASMSDGVFGATDWIVSADSPADLAVQVAPGNSMKSGHFVRSDAVESVPISANTSGYNRIDAIALQVDDVNKATTLAAVQGTPSSSPTPPILQANQLLLALVNVGNNVSVINQSAITDKRTTVAITPQAQTAAPLSDLDNSIYCDLRKTSSQSAASGTNSVIAWNVVNGDPYGLHNTTNPTRITANRAGRWMVSSVVRASGAIQLITQLYKNGTALPEAFAELGKTTSYPTVRLTLEITLAAGDYIELYVSNPNDAMTMTVSGCMFQARYMGPA